MLLWLLCGLTISLRINISSPNHPLLPSWVIMNVPSFEVVDKWASVPGFGVSDPSSMAEASSVTVTVGILSLTMRPIPLLSSRSSAATWFQILSWLVDQGTNRLILHCVASAQSWCFVLISLWSTNWPTHSSCCISPTTNVEHLKMIYKISRLTRCHMV